MSINRNPPGAGETTSNLVASHRGAASEVENSHI